MRPDIHLQSILHVYHFYYDLSIGNRIAIVKKNYVFMSYTFQDTEYDNGGDMRFVAKNKGNFGVNVNYWSELSILDSGSFTGTYRSPLGSGSL